MAYAITPMIESLGLQNTWLLVAFLGVAIFGVCFAVIAWGKDWRRATAPAYWKLVEQHGFHAH